MRHFPGVGMFGSSLTHSAKAVQQQIPGILVLFIEFAHIEKSFTFVSRVAEGRAASRSCKYRLCFLICGGCISEGYSRRSLASAR